MHYRNGREAKNGDRIIQIGFDGKLVALGILHDAKSGNDYCNGSIAPMVMSAGACLIDCIHADDLADLIAKAGLGSRPAGK